MKKSWITLPPFSIQLYSVGRPLNFYPFYFISCSLYLRNVFLFVGLLIRNELKMLKLEYSDLEMHLFYWKGQSGLEYNQTLGCFKMRMNQELLTESYRDGSRCRRWLVFNLFRTSPHHDQQRHTHTHSRTNGID